MPANGRRDLIRRLKFKNVALEEYNIISGCERRSYCGYRAPGGGGSAAEGGEFIFTFLKMCALE